MMLRHLALVALLVCISYAEADISWRSVRGADLRGMFVDHELADGVHYAYQFREVASMPAAPAPTDAAATSKTTPTRKGRELTSTESASPANAAA